MTPETRRLLAALAVLLLYLAFCALIAWRVRRRQAADAALSAVPGSPDGPPLLVAYASQTGTAEDLARRTAQSLRAGQVPVRIAGLDALDAAALAATRHAVFVVSTTGEGDAPDSAARFVRRVMGTRADLSGLGYGLLALGDSGYERYCSFGRRLDAWLQAQGARPLFDRVEVDDGEAGALRHWQYHLGRLAGTAGLPSEAADWAPARFQAWRLAERRLLNPGSPGGPVFLLALVAVDERAGWSAGDIAEIGPRNPPEAVERVLRGLGLDAAAAVGAEDGATLGEVLAARILPDGPAALEALGGLPPQELVVRLKPVPHREYSIASLPQDGRLELLVRQMRHPDGRLGLGSGWLTGHAPLGTRIALRVRSNPGFHAPEADRPLILIGNGTGLAGLRAHLKARRAAGRRRNWLVYGERTRAHDFLCQAEIEGWVAESMVQRLDLAFSRDQAARVHVQHRLREAAAELRSWVAAGAAIYVCGSLEGMATGVHAALGEALGTATLEHLAEEGRYRRDVY
jgi:sulfite reductase (NADPH) flavoprotein alpha-component